MSDWTDEIQGYEERNWEDLASDFTDKYCSLWNDFAEDHQEKDWCFEELAELFIERNDKLWYEFVSEKFFGCGLAERLGVMEP